MPCRLNDDVHEWYNEIATVPSWNLLNTVSWCEAQGLPMGSEDPMKLYCSLLLWRGFCHIV